MSDAKRSFVLDLHKHKGIRWIATLRDCLRGFVYVVKPQQSKINGQQNTKRLGFDQSILFGFYDVKTLACLPWIFCLLSFKFNRFWHGFWIERFIQLSPNIRKTTKNINVSISSFKSPHNLTIHFLRKKLWIRHKTIKLTLQPRSFFTELLMPLFNVKLTSGKPD